MIRRTRPPRGSPLPQPQDEPLPADQPVTRYVVERCAGGGDRAVYAVIDLERRPLTRVICRTSWADAIMVAGALNTVSGTDYEIVDLGSRHSPREATE